MAGLCHSIRILCSTFVSCSFFGPPEIVIVLLIIYVNGGLANDFPSLVSFSLLSCILDTSLTSRHGPKADL